MDGLLLPHSIPPHHVRSAADHSLSHMDLRDTHTSTDIGHFEALLGSEYSTPVPGAWPFVPVAGWIHRRTSRLGKGSGHQQRRLTAKRALDSRIPRQGSL